METLKLDIDISNFETVCKIIVNRCSVFGITKIKPLACRVFSTRHGYHVYLDVDKDMTPFELCFYQMAMGSDYKRETFNLFRFQNACDKKWNQLFSVKFDGAGNPISNEVGEPEKTKLLWDLIQKRVEGRV